MSKRSLTPSQALCSKVSALCLGAAGTFLGFIAPVQAQLGQSEWIRPDVSYDGAVLQQNDPSSSAPSSGPGLSSPSTIDPAGLSQSGLIRPGASAAAGFGPLQSDWVTVGSANGAARQPAAGDRGQAALRGGVSESFGLSPTGANQIYSPPVPPMPVSGTAFQTGQGSLTTSPDMNFNPAQNLLGNADPLSQVAGQLNSAGQSNPFDCIGQAMSQAAAMGLFSGANAQPANFQNYAPVQPYRSGPAGSLTNTMTRNVNYSLNRAANNATNRLLNRMFWH